jgi:hypothetical protein
MTGAHAERAHYPLGPSASSRWRKCIPSIALCAALPDPPESPAAAEGTYCHEWAEFCLRKLEFDVSPYIGLTLTAKVGAKPLTEAVAKRINVALQLVERLYEDGDEILIEAKLDLSAYFGGTPDGNGTADVIIYKPRTRTLIVIDFKFGFIEVAVEGNTQAIQYLLGALGLYRTRGVEKVHVHIAQPKSTPPYKEWLIDACDLFDAGIELRAAYARTKLPNQPYVAGSHCYFCKKKTAGCDAQREYEANKAAGGFVPA